MKKKLKQQKYSASMLVRLLIPMVFVFVFQTVVMVLMFFNSDIIQQSVDNAYGILSEKVLNRKIIIENEMVNRWSRIEDLHKKVLNVIQAELSQNNMEIYQIDLICKTVFLIYSCPNSSILQDVTMLQVFFWLLMHRLL